MKIDKSTAFIETEDDRYRVCIAMPDGSRNRLHTDLMDSLDSAIIIKENLEGYTIRRDFISVIPEKKYFRIVVNLPAIGIFHSRLLNINDVIYERMMLLLDY